MRNGSRKSSDQSLSMKFSALSSTTRIGILEMLDERGRLSFTELSKALNTNGPALVYHLSKLLDTKLIIKEPSDDPYSASYRMYAITDAGREVLNKFVYA